MKHNLKDEQYFKNYYMNHKKELQERRLCTCGKTYTYFNHERHTRSILHYKGMIKLNNVVEVNEIVKRKKKIIVDIVVHDNNLVKFTF